MSLPCLPEGPPLSVSLLAEVLELGRETWIRDFLFKMEPTTDVGILTSPAKIQHALVLDKATSKFETAGQYGGMFDLVSSSRWLILPAFNVDQFSADVVILSKETSSNPLFKAGGRDNIIRVVRNNSTGDALMSLDNRKSNTLTVWLFKREDKLRRKRICLHGKRQPFLQSLLSPTGIDFPKMMKSLAMFMESREVLSCPMCTYATPGARCVCPRNPKPPSHPLDFTNARENMMHHCGHFTGLSSVHLLEADFPVPITRAILNSIMNITPCTERGMVPAIIDMGIKNKISENCVVPPLMSSPAEDEVVGLSFASPSIVLSGEEIADFASVKGPGGFPFDKMRNDVQSNNNLSLAVGDPLRIEGASIGADIEVAGDVAVDVERYEQKERKRNRKLRNREAAARSNRKRKERYETLIENVSAIRQTKAELVERENSLKIENENLRMLLSKEG